MEKRKMWMGVGTIKRILCLLLVLLALGIEAALPAAAASDELSGTVEQQIRAFADTIDQPNADDEAASALARHGLTAGGKTLSVGKNHALTAMLMNAELTQAALVESVSEMITTMQQLGVEKLYADGGPKWETDQYTYYFLLYRDQPTEEASSSGRVTCSDFTGSGNAYDKALEWITGSSNLEICLEKVETKDQTIVYDISLLFSDRFDFDVRNSTGSVSKDLATLLGSVLFQEFDWNATVRFQLEIPNTCNHTAEAFHWIYDAARKTLTSDGGAGYTENCANQILQNHPSADRYYYKLEKDIVLRHDYPWVLEYAVKNPNKFAFSTALNKETTHPYLLNYHRDYLFVACKSNDAATTKYYGTALDAYFSYNTDDTYIFRLENVISAEGDNMIYVTVYNADLQTTVLETTPMDDCYVIENGSWRCKDTAAKGVSGLDLTIKYIGNESYRFSPDAFELSIWVKGQEKAYWSYFTDVPEEPTCASQGYTVHTCSKCGYSYKDSYVAATGHSFGDWSMISEATCTQPGVQERVCEICGEKETDTIPALGHDPVQHPGQTPTCTEAGWSAYETCSRCDYTGYQTISAQGHSHIGSVTAPTCTQQGYTTYTCHCGDSYVDDFISENGHSFGTWYTQQEPACEAQGTQRRDCANCDHYEEQTLGVMGHDHVSTVTAPTCTQDGCTTYTCTRCGDSFTQDPTPATGHTYGPWEDVKAPTVQETGLRQRACTSCADVERQEIPKLEPPVTEPDESATHPTEAPSLPPLAEPERDPFPTVATVGAAALVVLIGTVLALIFKKRA